MPHIEVGCNFFQGRWIMEIQGPVWLLRSHGGGMSLCPTTCEAGYPGNGGGWFAASAEERCEELRIGVERRGYVRIRSRRAT
jgi:hypothetical protein